MINYQALKLNIPLEKLKYLPQIRLAPWCFPIKDKASLPVGAFPIITVDSKGKSSLLLLTPNQPKKAIEKYFPPVEAVEEFQVSIRNTHIWLETQLPIWIKNPSPQKPFVYCVYTDDHQDPPKIVDGHSAGLALLLLQLSVLLNQPLPKDLICSVALKGNGSLESVLGLKEKLTTIVKHCPLIQKIVVHRQQEKEAQAVLDALKPNIPIKLLAFETVKEVLEHENIILPESGQTIIETLKLILQKQDPPAFIDFLFYRVLKGADQIFGWNSLSKTLELIRRENHKDLNDDDLKMLKLLLLISDRYAQNQHTPKEHFKKEDIEWILKFPAPTILQVLPHLLQQLAYKPKTIKNDAQKIIIEQAETYISLVEKHIVIAPPFLRIFGAYGRYQKKHNPDKAFEIQTKAFDGWLANSVYEEASYPLCELLFLAGKHQKKYFHEQALHRYRLLHNRPNGITTENQGYVFFEEMCRRYANNEDWKEIAEKLHNLLNSFPLYLQKKIKRTIETWSAVNSFPPN